MWHVGSGIAKEHSLTVKSCYEALEGRPLVGSSLQSIWQIKAPMRVMVFIWLMLQNRILMVDNVMARGWSMVNMCYMCRQNSESLKRQRY